ncbi:MAG: hypothetical protein QXL96_02025 [Ignisphaera sp.]
MNRFFATVILFAVAVSLAAAIISWILTTYHSMMWKPEILRIKEVNIYQNEEENSWWLKIVAVNEGEGTAEIYKIEIHGIETIDINPAKTIKPGEQKEIQIKLNKQYTYGTTYTIRLYLKSGSLYPILEKVIKL